VGYTRKNPFSVSNLMILGGQSVGESLNLMKKALILMKNKDN